MGPARIGRKPYCVGRRDGSGAPDATTATARYRPMAAASGERSWSSQQGCTCAPPYSGPCRADNAIVRQGCQFRRPTAHKAASSFVAPAGKPVQMPAVRALLEWLAQRFSQRASLSPKGKARVPHGLQSLLAGPPQGRVAARSQVYAGCGNLPALRSDGGRAGWIPHPVSLSSM